MMTTASGAASTPPTTAPTTTTKPYPSAGIKGGPTFLNRPVRNRKGVNDEDEEKQEEEEEEEETSQSWHEMLDPDLQPEPPIENNYESQQIYEEHKQLAKAYLQVDTNLYYARDFKRKFLADLEPTERREKEELLQKLNEKVS